MSEPVSTYPDALSPGSWEKKKGSLPAGSDVPDKLKSLQKKHGAVEWKLFDGEWATKAKTEAELDEAYALRERIYRSGVMPLKRDANDLANAARAMAKEKAAAKPTLDAAKAIGAAVNDFVDAIDALADVLAKACDKARPALVKADAEAKAKAKAKAKDDGEDDEEEDTPVLLTTKMIPLIRELRKGEVRMHAMIGRAGANTAVLIMRKPIAPARRKLLAEAVDAKGGAKFIVAECFLEDKALTFVVQSPAAGLAKRVRQALLDQVELRLKVKVRGDDGVEDKDGENEEGPPAGDKPKGEAPSLQAIYEQTKRELYPRLSALVREAGEDRDLVLNLMGKAGKAEKTADWAAGLEIYDQLTEIVERQRGQDAAATATATATTAAAADGKAATPADPGAAFNARLAALMPAIKAAIVAAGPSAQDIKLKVSEAGMLARKKEFVAAGTLLDQVDKMVKPAGATKPQAGGLDDVDFRKRWSRAADGWRQAVDTVNAQVEKLQSALRGIDDAELKDIAEFGLPGVTGNHRSRLMAAMMDIDAAQGEALSKAAGRAARLAQGFEGYLASSEAVEATDTNPFGVHVSIRASLGPALAAIQQALAPVA